MDYFLPKMDFWITFCDSGGLKSGGPGGPDSGGLKSVGPGGTHSGCLKSGDPGGPGSGGPRSY